MDRDVNRLTAVTSGAMIIVLLIIAGISVKPYIIIEQEHVLYSGLTTVTIFDHPALQPTASKYQGTGP